MPTALDIQRRIQSGRYLIVHKRREIAHPLKSVVKTLGAYDVVVAKTFGEALPKITINKATDYVLFEAIGADPAALQFAQDCIKACPNAIMIGLLEPAYLDDVFEMLDVGVKGFVVVPCNGETLEKTLIGATVGLSLPKELSGKSGRDAVFANTVVKNLDLLAETKKRNRDGESTLATKYRKVLKDSMRMAKRFFTGSREDLRDAIGAKCIENTEALDARFKTRLGKIRRQLAEERKIVTADSSLDEQQEDPPPPST